MLHHTIATSDLGVSTAVELCSPEEGPRVVIVGGHHGDEPAGYALAGLLSVYMRVERGSLLIVPQANPGAVLCHKRWSMHKGQSLDLNRCYNALPEGVVPPPELAHYKLEKTPELQHAAQILNFIHQWKPSVVIDLHESYTPGGDKLPPSDPGKHVLAWTVSCGLRGKILAPKDIPHVSVNQPGSLISAMEVLGIAGLAIETRKSPLSFQDRVLRQMDILGQILRNHAGFDVPLPTQQVLSSVV
jgi:predicted deacylase